MPSWLDYVTRVEQAKSELELVGFFKAEINRLVGEVRRLRKNQNVIFYASAWLQKQGLPGNLLSLMPEEINGFMAVMKGMDWEKGLTLILHTPGGSPNAAETVGEYLLSKFPFIETVIPTYAQSAGTMLAMVSDRLMMGRQSQLGPIDPQLLLGQMPISALSVKAQFELAKREIIAEPKVAHAWAPILQSLGPGLLVESQRAVEYGKKVVARWLAQRALKGQADAKKRAQKIAQSLAAAPTNINHGQRIDIAEARRLGLTVDQLEDDQPLQEAVLSLYHITSILFDKSPIVKLIVGSQECWWMKNFVAQLPQPGRLQVPQQPQPPAVQPRPTGQPQPPQPAQPQPTGAEPTQPAAQTRGTSEQ